LFQTCANPQNRRYWLAIIDAIAADVKGDVTTESQSSISRDAVSEDAVVSALSLLDVHQLIVGMDEPDLFPKPLADAMLHPFDFAFLKVLQELMAGTVTSETHDTLFWCSQYSGDCAFILSSLLTVGDSRMGLERDVIRASTLLQECSIKSDNILCRLAWSSRLRVSRDADDRSASERLMDDVESLLQVPPRRALPLPVVTSHPVVGRI
jgi:hypothetical protein